LFALPRKNFFFLLLKIFPRGAFQVIEGEDSLIGRATKILEEFQAGEGKYPGKHPQYSWAMLPTLFKIIRGQK
jgi:hypothetical protein